jgi:hypothetical protein
MSDHFHEASDDCGQEGGSGPQEVGHAAEAGGRNPICIQQCRNKHIVGAAAQP